MQTKTFTSNAKPRFDLRAQLNKLGDECNDMMEHLYERKIDSAAADSFMIFLGKWVEAMKQRPSIMPKPVAELMYKELRLIHRHMKKDLNVE